MIDNLQAVTWVAFQVLWQFNRRKELMGRWSRTQRSGKTC